MNAFSRKWKCLFGLGGKIIIRTKTSLTNGVTTHTQIRNSERGREKEKKRERKRERDRASNKGKGMDRKREKERENESERVS